MGDLTKTILESGLVDESTVRLMERWGYLPEGSADLAKRKELETATRAELTILAEKIGEEVDKKRRLKETMLDLNALRWPTVISLGAIEGQMKELANIEAVIDRMGRYYFRPADIDKSWFIPGRRLSRKGFIAHEIITEVTELFVGDQVAAIQVSTHPA